MGIPDLDVLSTKGVACETNVEIGMGEGPVWVHPSIPTSSSRAVLKQLSYETITKKRLVRYEHLTILYRMSSNAFSGYTTVFSVFGSYFRLSLVSCYVCYAV